MKPSSQQLSLRDPALAAILGVDANRADFGVQFGDESFGAEFGEDPQPTQAEMAKAWQGHIKASRDAARSEQRGRLLEPNRGSSVKIEKYAFAMSDSCVLGTAKAVLALSGNPATDFRPQRLIVNAPAPGFALISAISVANVKVSVGGTEDAWGYNANAVDSDLDMPTLSPANRAVIDASYTGYTPAGYVAAAAFLITASFRGPASIVA